MTNRADIERLKADRGLLVSALETAGAKVRLQLFLIEPDSLIEVYDVFLRVTEKGLAILSQRLPEERAAGDPGRESPNDEQRAAVVGQRKHHRTSAR